MLRLCGPSAADGYWQRPAETNRVFRAHLAEDADRVFLRTGDLGFLQDGNLFVTGPKGIWVWDATGHHLGTIVVPEQPANLAWGDKDYRTLYITATTSVYRLQMKAEGFVPYLSK